MIVLSSCLLVIETGMLKSPTVKVNLLIIVILSIFALF